MTMMATMLNQALAGKKIAKGDGRPVPAAVRHPVKRVFKARAHREVAGRWFAFDTPHGRVARQGKFAITVPPTFKRVGDQNGYETPQEAMRYQAIVGENVPFRS